MSALMPGFPANQASNRATNMTSSTRTSDSQAVSSEGVVVFVFCLLTGVGVSAMAKSPVGLLLGTIVGLYFMLSIKVANQWDKAAVLRLGKYKGLRGPGLFLIVPVIEKISGYVDQRVRVTDVSAESALTRDTVPVGVDAIVFWLVWDAEK